MSEKPMSKEQLLQAFADAYEQVIEVATKAAESSLPRGVNGWGPREIVAHLTGWEMMATVRIPAIVGGMEPLEFGDEAQNQVMDDAINGAFVTLVGDQPLAAVSAMLRQTYQRNVAWLKTLDNRFFQPGEYVYERTRGIIGHCEEHIEMLLPSSS